MTNFTPATEKQINFIKDLAAKDWDAIQNLGDYSGHDTDWFWHVDSLKEDEIKTGIIKRNFRFYFEESHAVRIISKKKRRRWTETLTIMNLNSLSKDDASTIIGMLKSGGSIDMDSNYFDEWVKDAPAREIQKEFIKDEISVNIWRSILNSEENVENRHELLKFIKDNLQAFVGEEISFMGVESKEITSLKIGTITESEATEVLLYLRNSFSQKLMGDFTRILRAFKALKSIEQEVKEKAEIKAIIESQEISIEDPLSEDSESTIVCEEKSFYSDFAFERELESLPAFGGEFIYNEAPSEDIKYYVSYFRVKHHCAANNEERFIKNNSVLYSCTCEEEIQEKRALL